MSPAFFLFCYFEIFDTDTFEMVKCQIITLDANVKEDFLIDVLKC